MQLRVPKNVQRESGSRAQYRRVFRLELRESAIGSDRSSGPTFPMHRVRIWINRIHFDWTGLLYEKILGVHQIRGW